MFSRIRHHGWVVGAFGLVILVGIFSFRVIAAANFNAQDQFLPLVMRPELPTATPTPTSTPTPTPTPTGQPVSGWLSYVNQFRALANLPAVSENTDWSDGGVLHSRYMVKEDEITHYENPESPWYTQAGYDAGRNGNVAVYSSVSGPDELAIDLWMSGPFHAVGIIDPQLAQTGFGSYRESIGTWRMGATLDVLRGLGSVPSGVSFPIHYPKDGGQLWLTDYGGNEAPDPLTSCSGYTAPSGPPIILQLGSGSVTPNVTASSLQHNGTDLEFCIFDETNYVNGNSDYQNLGRAVLGGRDAVVILPRYPLTVGETYTASITVNGATYTWSFSVAVTTTYNQPEIDWQTR
jgi:uncharacterized protein YkwD